MWFKTNPDKNSNLNNQTQQRITRKEPTRSPDLRKTVTTIRIPRTHDGLLARKLSEAENRLRTVFPTKVKVVESVGKILKSILVKANLWANQNCPRNDCLPCRYPEI